MTVFTYKVEILKVGEATTFLSISPSVLTRYFMASLTVKEVQVDEKLMITRFWH